MAFTVIALIPTYTTDATTSLRALDAKIHEAQDAFSPATLLPLPVPTILPADATGRPELNTPVKSGSPTISVVGMPAAADGAIAQVGDVIEPVADPLKETLEGDVDGSIAGEVGGVCGGISGGFGA